jgi:hypothetical protein
MGVKEPSGCAYWTGPVFANSVNEAANCVQQNFPGMTVVNPPVDMDYYQYSSTNRFGCSSGQVPAFSSSDAEQCAQWMNRGSTIVIGGSCRE